VIGETLAHYRITAVIGAGGMGEVYRATDEKLGREVALKVLPEGFAKDPDRMARFEREARVLASLNHPNIATLYGLETVESGTGTGTGTGTFLAMELVEGEELSELIKRGPISVQEAMPIALQIAEALEAAHEAGIVHRDLKPANIKVTHDGTVKVLDFGLATAWETEGGDSSLSMSPTLTARATAAGVILGTAAYMSPEQARGQKVDRRADIWAFGVVLWEMLIGRKLFDGNTVTDVLAAVVRQEIDFDSLPQSTPPAIRRLLHRCLERLLQDRLHDIADGRLEIDAAMHGAVEETVPAHVAGGRRWLGMAGFTSIVLGIVLGALAAWYLRPVPNRPAWKLGLAPPAELSGFRLSTKISPDGRSMAYIADGKLWIQDLDGLTPRQVPSSDGTSALTWSPDGRLLAFAARSALWRTLPNGDVALVTTLSEVVSSSAGGVTWTDDDRIVYSTGDSGLYTVPVGGGTPTVLLEPDKPRESDFHEPLALPGGRGIVFIIHRAAEGIDTVGLLAGGERRTLMQKDGEWWQSPSWSEAGYLLLASSGSNPGVWAVPMRSADVTVTGEPFLVAANTGAPSISRDGTLLLSRTSNIGRHQLSLIDRTGERTVAVGEPVSHADNATFSPDGAKIAICVYEAQGQSIWVYDLERHSRSRLWSNVMCGGAQGGIAWSPDGQRLLMSDRSTGTIRSRRADGSDEEIEVVDGFEPDVSPDERLVVFTRNTEETGSDLWVGPLDNAASARPFLASPATEEHPQVSPDGRFIAYVSDETGRSEIQLRPFPEGHGRWQVSFAGGDLPRWSGNGTRLYFLQDDNLVMEVEVTLGETPLLSDPHRIFSAASHRLGPEHGYDVAPDGESFVTVAFGEETEAGGDLTLISPWPSTSGEE
jgi:Tol biopolymer transport system component